VSEVAIQSSGIKPMAVIYLRVSTKEQAERGGEREGFSIPAQREACVKKAESMGAVVVAEFVDAGESARSANRPELKNMLAYVKEHRVKHVIVHKIDRLARNRADDVEINVFIRAAGASLVSCSENIDETPSGTLLHGIMSSIAEFYSHNLAAESKKGMLQKVKSGGTPGLAPFGYLNVRERTDEGRELRTVVVDEERAQWVRWLYEMYATGDWTSARLRDELADRGVTSVQRPKQPARPLAVSQIDAILRNRYYVGVVTYNGVEYPGRHTPLVNESLFSQVQRIRQSRVQSGEKPRVHSHYLKGSVFCGGCGEPLTFTHARSRTGELYQYFVCLGRTTRRNGCTFKAMPAAQLEQAVVEYWARIQLSETQLNEIRDVVLAHIGEALPTVRSKREELSTLLRQLERESRKVLDAFYADAIDTPELQREQARIAARRAFAEAERAKLEVEEGRIVTNLDHCLQVLSDAKLHYEASDGTNRRMLNQSVFVHLWVEDDEIVASDLSPAYHRLTSESLRTDLQKERKRDQSRSVQTRALVSVPDVDTSATRGGADGRATPPLRTGQSRLYRRSGAPTRLERPRGALPWEKQNHGPLEDRGSDQYLLVAPTGLEPVTLGL